MAKASISIGVDDATGQPANAPEGPYITDVDDGTRPRKNRTALVRPAPVRPARDRASPAGGRARDADRNKDPASRRGGGRLGADRPKGPAQP